MYLQMRFSGGQGTWTLNLWVIVRGCACFSPSGCHLLLRYIIHRVHGVNTRHPAGRSSTPPASCSRVSCGSLAPRNSTHTINIIRMSRTAPNGPSQWFCCRAEKLSRVSYSIFQFWDQNFFCEKYVEVTSGQWGLVGICVTLACLKCFSSPHANDRNGNYDLISDGVQTVSLWVRSTSGPQHKTSAKYRLSLLKVFCWISLISLVW